MCPRFVRKDRFGTVYVVIMSCRKKSEQAGGVGCSGAKVGNAAKVDEDDDEEDEWTEDDDEETDGSRSTYKKYIWKVVAIWTHIDKEEAYRREAEIMTADFSVVGGPTHSWGQPSLKKIGPFSYRRVSVYFRFIRFR